MKITAIDAINLAEFPNVLWVQIHTDEGYVALSETFYMSQPSAAHVHESCVSYLFGKNLLEIDKQNWEFLRTYVGFASAGEVVRAN